MLKSDACCMHTGGHRRRSRLTLQKLLSSIPLPRACPRPRPAGMHKMYPLCDAMFSRVASNRTDIILFFFETVFFCSSSSPLLSLSFLSSGNGELIGFRGLCCGAWLCDSRHALCCTGGRRGVGRVSDEGSWVLISRPRGIGMSSLKRSLFFFGRPGHLYPCCSAPRVFFLGGGGGRRAIKKFVEHLFFSFFQGTVSGVYSSIIILATQRFSSKFVGYYCAGMM